MAQCRTRKIQKHVSISIAPISINGLAGWLCLLLRISMRPFRNAHIITTESEYCRMWCALSEVQRGSAGHCRMCDCMWMFFLIHTLKWNFLISSTPVVFSGRELVLERTEKSRFHTRPWRCRFDPSTNSAHTKSNYANSISSANVYFCTLVVNAKWTRNDV